MWRAAQAARLGCIDAHPGGSRVCAHLGGTCVLDGICGSPGPSSAVPAAHGFSSHLPLRFKAVTSNTLTVYIADSRGSRRYKEPEKRAVGHL